jgi:hypothetical protein
MDVEEVIAVIAYVWHRKQKLKKKQKLWVHHFIADRPTSGMFCEMYSDLRKYPGKFFSYLHLSIESFDELLTICENNLTKQDTILRNSISPEEKALAFVAAMPVVLALGILVGSYAKLEAQPDGCQVQYMTTKLIH